MSSATVSIVVVSAFSLFDVPVHELNPSVASIANVKTFLVIICFSFVI